MAEFQPAFVFVMQHEDASRSGKVTVDAGGRTRFGIAEKFHADLPDDFFTGAPANALKVAEQIYHRDYWEPLRLSEVENQNLAEKIFDMAVNMGTHQAAIYAQRAANGLIAIPAQRLHEDGVSARQLSPPSTHSIPSRYTSCFANGRGATISIWPPSIPRRR